MNSAYNNETEEVIPVEEETVIVEGGPPFTDPVCQPISIAFSPVLNTTDAPSSIGSAFDTSATAGKILSQSLVGVVSISLQDAKRSMDFRIDITSTIQDVVIVQPQVVIPKNFTSARVYAIYRAESGVATPVVFVSAYGGMGTPVSTPIAVPHTPGSGRTYDDVAFSDVTLADAPEPVITITVPSLITQRGPAAGCSINVEHLPPGGMDVYLSVNLLYQPYFQLPPQPMHVTAASTPFTPNIALPPNTINLFVTASSGTIFGTSSACTIKAP